MTHFRIVFVENGIEDEVWIETNLDIYIDREILKDFHMEHPNAEIVTINQLD